MRKSRVRKRSSLRGGKSSLKKKFHSKQVKRNKKSKRVSRNSKRKSKIKITKRRKMKGGA